jgi:hypothetical protein
MIRIYNRDRALADAIKRLDELERRTGGPDAIDGPDAIGGGAFNTVTEEIDDADAIDGADLVEVITRIAERAAERVAESSAEEIDADAIWAKIEERVADAALDAARDVIRNELVAHFGRHPQRTGRPLRSDLIRRTETC